MNFTIIFENQNFNFLDFILFYNYTKWGINKFWHNANCNNNNNNKFCRVVSLRVSVLRPLLVYCTLRTGRYFFRSFVFWILSSIFSSVDYLTALGSHFRSLVILLQLTKAFYNGTSNEESFSPLFHIIYRLNFVLFQCCKGVCLARSVLSLYHYIHNHIYF